MSFSDLTDAALGTCTALLGQAVTYTPLGGSPVTINGIFESKFFEIASGNGLPIMSRKPTLGIRLSDLAAEPDEGDTVLVGATNYKVLATDDDGNGGTTLLLALTS